MKILGLVPARGGSKGVKRKNLRHLRNKSLLSWTLDCAKRSMLKDIYVTSDDSEITRAARDAGVPTISRPASLADDQAKSIDVVQHALETLHDRNFDAVMLLQPTSPFRSSEDIDEAMRIFKTKNADSLVSVNDVGGSHPSRMRYLEDGLLKQPEYALGLEGVPRQQLNQLYILNGAIYLTRVDTIAQGSFTGEHSIGFVMPPERSINIDTEFDLLVAEQLAFLFRNDESLFEND